MEKVIRSYAEDSEGSLSPETISLGADGSEFEVGANTSDDMSFDEYSNLFGRKARARRQRRRLERIRNRQERRRLRRAGRREAMRERQEMRTERKQRRLARKKLGEEEDTQEEAPVDSGDMASEEAPIEEAPIEEAPQEYGDPDANVDEETGESDYESEFTGECGFDGARQPSQADEYYDNFYSAEGGKMIAPNIKELSRRIEKVKSKIADLTAQLAKFDKKTGANVDKSEMRVMQYLINQIKLYQGRLAKLESMLAGYSKFDGDYMNADGSELDEVAKRKSEVRIAKMLARKERKAALRRRRKVRVMEIMKSLRAKGMGGKEALAEARRMAFSEIPIPSGAALDVADGVTPPTEKMDAAINQGATSSFDSDGLYALDDNSPVNRMSSADGEFYSADGSTKKKTWMWIGIGVGVAVIGILAYSMLKRRK